MNFESRIKKPFLKGLMAVRTGEKIFLGAYGCTAASAMSTAELWDQVDQARTSARALADLPSVKAHLWPTKPELTQKQKLLEQLTISFDEAYLKLNQEKRDRISQGASLGVILASTKGFVDDVVWHNEHARSDTLMPLLDEFLKQVKIEPAKKICVSNACASAVSSIYLASEWLKRDGIEDVLVLACDAVGPFVLKGFQTLKVFATGETKPFAFDRSGFYLGEASACLFLSHSSQGGIHVEKSAIEAEGYAVTRPSQSGASLVQAAQGMHDIDFVVAHGTATLMNDISEDAAYHELFSALRAPPVITASKWSIGHTLGASSAIDVILACESLRRKKIFSIATTDRIDPQFRGHYLFNGSERRPQKFARAMVSSLGFGGLHTAVTLSKDEAS